MAQLLATPWRRVWIFMLSIAPALLLLWRLYSDNLGPEPAKTIVIFTGTWAANFLVFTLAVTPLKKYFHFTMLSPHRRMLGLFCWFYASVHLACYLLFILGADFKSIAQELTQRPFITASIPAWLLLSLLAATSPRFVMRICGKYWKYIHRSIYVIAFLVVIHIAWQVRATYQTALVYGFLLLGLLALRLPSNRKNKGN